MTPPDIDLQLSLTNQGYIGLSLYFFGTAAWRRVGRWLEKLRIIPAQPPTEAGVGAELGNKVSTIDDIYNEAFTKRFR